MKKNKVIIPVLILILIIIIISGTYAWFINNTEVNLTLTGRVQSWDVNIEGDDGSGFVNVSIDDPIYPGMETAEKEVKVTNSGDINAKLTYKINENVLVFGESKNINDLPFQIEVKFIDGNEEKDSVDVYAGDEKILKASISWDFESGNDALDTELGKKAYEAITKGDTTPNFEIQIELIAEQLN